MLRVAISFLLVCALVTLVNTARADGLFKETIKLRNGQLLVVEESDLEPRSVGSYSLRLYSNERPEFPYDRFVTGLLEYRDGVLEAAAELDSKHCDDCFMICMRSVGTGSALTRHVYSYGNNRLTLHYDEVVGCAETLACEDLGESRWEWPEPGPELDGAENANE